MLLELNEKQKKVVRALTRNYKDLNELKREIDLPENILESILAFLVEAKYAELEQKIEKYYDLTIEGKEYYQNGLPEENLIKIINSGINSINDLKVKFKDLNLFNIAILWAKKSKWIDIKAGKVELITVLAEIEKAINNIKEVLKNPNEKHSKDLLNELLQRKIIIEKERKIKRFRLNSDTPDEEIKKMLELENRDELTPEDIKTGNWRNYTYKKYIITDAYNPPKYFGKTNAYLDFLNIVRENLLALGFEEFYSPSIDLEFYNCDILFMPQDHVARGIHDLFKIEGNIKGTIENKSLLQNVKQIHLNGGNTGSTGWKYNFNDDISRNLVLRSQTTCTSAHFLEYISKERPNEDVKMMCIDLNWRPDTRDRTHSFEFRQCEGIITGDNLSIKNLLGFLTEICHSIGISEIKFMPGYFPFTEPSVSGYIKHPKLGWIEALPGGIFRPEVCGAYNFKKTVLAYGIGIDRLAMAALDIDDIRDLYSTDLEKVKNFKIYKNWR